MSDIFFWLQFILVLVCGYLIGVSDAFNRRDWAYILVVAGLALFISAFMKELSSGIEKAREKQAQNS